MEDVFKKLAIASFFWRLAVLELKDLNLRPKQTLVWRASVHVRCGGRMRRWRGNCPRLTPHTSHLGLYMLLGFSEHNTPNKTKDEQTSKHLNLKVQHKQEQVDIGLECGKHLHTDTESARPHDFTAITLKWTIRPQNRRTTEKAELRHELRDRMATHLSSPAAAAATAHRRATPRNNMSETDQTG